MTMGYLKNLVFHRTITKKDENNENIYEDPKSEEARINVKGEEKLHRIKYLIMNCEKMEHIDFSGCKDLIDICKEFENAGVIVLFAELRSDLESKLLKCGCKARRLAYSEMGLLQLLDILCSDNLDFE